MEIDVGHMGGEGTETLLDTLLITDVRIDIIKNSQFGSILCRNMQTSLSHQGEQANRFQGQSVLPPVFGPVMISRWKVSPRCTSMGTTFFWDPEVGDVPAGCGCVLLY